MKDWRWYFPVIPVIGFFWVWGMGACATLIVVWMVYGGSWVFVLPFGIRFPVWGACFLLATNIGLLLRKEPADATTP